MSEKAETFSFPCFRRLYRYLGETDAMVELTELASRSFLTAARGSGDIPMFLKQETAKHGIHVNLAEVESLSRHLTRTYIVLVASAVERFLKELREEHSALYRKAWIGDANKKDRLIVVFENLAGSESNVLKRIGSDVVSRFQYYRHLRNWIIHDQESNLSEPQENFESLVPLTEANSELYKLLKSPNPPAELVFDDFILFSRLTKRVAEALCTMARPPDDHWKDFLDLRPFKKLEKDPERMKNAISGKIRTDYGMEAPTANWIAENIMAH